MWLFFFSSSLSLHDAATLWILVAVVITRTTYLNVPRAFELDYTEKKNGKKWNCTRYSRSRKLFTVFFFSSSCVLSCGDTVHSNSYSSTCSLTLNTYRSICIVARCIRSKYCIFDGFLHYGFLWYFFLIVVDCRLRRRHCRLSRFTLFIFYLLLLFPSTRLLIYLFIFFFYAYFFFSLFMYSRYIHAARNLSLEFFIFIYIFVRHYISRLSIQRPQIEALLVFQSQRLK